MCSACGGGQSKTTQTPFTASELAADNLNVEQCVPAQPLGRCDFTTFSPIFPPGASIILFYTQRIPGRSHLNI